MKVWSDIGFEVETTDDGSLSLRLLESVDPAKFKGESMHHSGGAWAETRLIYGTPIRETLEQIKKPQFMIVGLGLGYIELNIAREALLLGLDAQSIGRITTYESVPELRYFFFHWIHNQPDKMHNEIWKTYEYILRDVVAETSLQPFQLKEFLAHLFQNEKDLEGALQPETTFNERYHLILYDAFSSKTTPFLWEQEYLTRVLSEAAAGTCLFSTYASRVSLKAALAETGFEVITRPGFVGKRNSTLGRRKASN